MKTIFALTVLCVMTLFGEDVSSKSTPLPIKKEKIPLLPSLHFALNSRPRWQTSFSEKTKKISLFGSKRLVVSFQETTHGTTVLIQKPCVYP